MKKNNRGFTLVEIIVTFSMVSTISFLLFQLILSLKNVYATSNFKTILLIDQGNITRRINTDLFTKQFLGAEACDPALKDTDSKFCYLFYVKDEGTDDEVAKKLEVFDERVVYDGFTMEFAQTGSKLGKVSAVVSYTEDLQVRYNSMLTVDIPITNKLVEGDYGIHFTIQFSSLNVKVDDNMLNDRHKVDIVNTSVRDMIAGITVKGDGLYAMSGKSWWNKDDKYIARYVYMGENPNNYVIYSNKCYRIISISNIFNNLDQTWLKLIYEGPNEDGECKGALNTGTVGSDVWGVAANNNSWLGDNAYLKKAYLPNWFSGLNANENRIHDTASPFVGAVNGTTTSVAALINDEKVNDGSTSLPVRSMYYDASGTKVYLPTVSDFVMASLDPACFSANSAYTTDSCANKNYLTKNYSYWTINPVSGTTGKVWIFNSNGKISESLVLATGIGVRPVIFLKGNTKFSGLGTSKNPYVVR